MVECQTVNLDVTGSNPVIHPLDIKINNFIKKFKKTKFNKNTLTLLFKKTKLSHKILLAFLDFLKIKFQKNTIFLKRNTKNFYILDIYLAFFIIPQSAALLNLGQVRENINFSKKFALYCINVKGKQIFITVFEKNLKIKKSYSTGKILKRTKSQLNKKSPLSAKIFLKFLEKRIKKLVKRNYNFIIKIKGFRKQNFDFIKSVFTYFDKKKITSILLDINMSFAPTKRKRYASIKRSVLRRLFLKRVIQ